MSSIDKSKHKIHRIGWLRASVLGANDGLVSISSLVVGVAVGGASQGYIFLTGVAGLVAGAISMAAGEYISVQSQADTEKADLNVERQELIDDPEEELRELQAIYVKRGLDEKLARQVAEQLSAGDALAAHARDELGFTEELKARPIQAAFASAAAFSAGGVVPVLAAMLSPVTFVSAVTTAVSILMLSVLGALAAYAGGAPIFKGAFRVTFWGAVAMGATAIVGKLVGVSV